MKKIISAIAVSLAALLVVPCFAQNPDPSKMTKEELVKTVKALREENAVLKIANTTNMVAAISQRMQEQYNLQVNPLNAQHAQAIKELESLHPGQHWDEQQKKLVDNPKEAPSVIPAPAPVGTPTPAKK